MKKMIMFVTYDFSDLSSGSKVRPKKMYEAFKEIGYDVFLISGNKIEKEESFERLKKEETINFDFCYVEPSSYPMQPLIDYKIIKYIKNKNIPIGIFYRDAYWKFYNQFSFKGFKNLELKIRYQLDLLFFKSISKVMFFPSNEMADYFRFNQPKIALPPAVDEYVDTGKIKNKIPIAIYVGGISERYGTELLLKSFGELNKNSLKVKLLLVCREKEYWKNINLFNSFKDSEWLNVKHVSGSLLESEYQNADFGVIPILKDQYNDFAVPVKLFEYLSYGLPIVATNCNVLQKYVIENNIGIIKEDSIISFAEGLNIMSENHPKYNQYIESFVRKDGLWKHRAEKVVKTLEQ
ncbi:glycosyltransferase [Oceanobacillus picturae]|uniref:glycosyltransferase n=1 Tax=Oceanobacillus picturae TaxID=171693 RepID=UPI000E68D400|nr:glycosyltransferase [Oceanobacillus picturae]RIU94755.1 glycosyltransferase family 1 protein [Oceanobacillus picturae]